MLEDDLLKEVERGREGLNQGSTTGMAKLDEWTGGNLPNNFSLIVGSSGTGKSSLAQYSYLYRPLREHENDDNYFCYLFSLEMSANMVLGKLLSTYLYEEFGKRLSVNHIFSRKKGYILPDAEYELVKKGINWIKKVKSKFIIFDKALNAEVLYSRILSELEKRGRFEETEDRKIYIPNNPNLLFSVMIDHISLAVPSKGRDLKREIDLITAYLVTLRNMAKISPVIVQQINRDASSMDRRKAGLSDVRMSDAADSADPSKAAEIMLAVFSPHKERLKNYEKFNIEVLQDNFRAIQILKSRYGASDIIVPCGFWGDINFWRDLPKAEEITDFNNYLEPNFQKEEVPDTSEFDENPTIFTL